VSFLGLVSLFLLSNHAKQDPNSETLWSATKFVKSGWLVKKERKLLHDVAFPDHATHLTFSGHQLATKCKYTTDLE
jgi:hypothetical protein